MTEISVTVDTGKPLVVSAIIQDTTQVYVADTAFRSLFGKDAHIQVTAKSVLVCTADLCVPFSRTDTKKNVIEDKGIWYVHLNTYAPTIGKSIHWKEEGKVLEIKTIRKFK